MAFGDTLGESPAVWIQALEHEDLARRHPTTPVDEPVPSFGRSSPCQAWRTAQHHGRSPVACRTHGGGGQWVQVSVDELLHRVQHLPLLGGRRWQRTHQLAHGLRVILLQEIIEIRAGSRRCAGPREWFLRVASANADDVHPWSALGHPEIFGVEDFGVPVILLHTLQQVHHSCESLLMLT